MSSQIAFSPDDRRLALATSNFAVQVYDVASWTLLWQIVHTDTVSAVAFTPDGSAVVSASFDGTVKVWDAANGTPRYAIDYGAWPQGPSFSADGRLMGSGSRTGKAIVNQTGNGQRMAELQNELPITALAISPNGPWLAVMTAGSYGPVEMAVWDYLTTERRTLSRYEGLPDPSNVAFSPDTRWLAGATQMGGPLLVWQTQTWPEVARLSTPGGWVQQTAFSPDSHQLAAVVMPDVLNTSLLLWDVPSWQPERTIALGDYTLAMAYSPDSRLIATVHGQGEPPTPPLNEGRLWDASSGALLARMPHDAQVQGLAFSHDGRWVATGSVDGTTRDMGSAWQVEAPASWLKSGESGPRRLRIDP